MEPRSVELAIEARWVVPVEPDGAILHDHTVIVDGSTIADVLPTVDAREKYAPISTKLLPDHVLLPGFVNAHTHAPMTLLRGLADDLPLMTWLQDHIWPTEAKWTGPDFVGDGTALSIAEMLSSGITTYNDMYFFPEVSAQLAEQVGIRFVAGMIVFDNETSWSKNAEDAIAKGIDLHAAWKDSSFVSTIWAPHAPYTVSNGPWARVAELADEMDVRVNTHLHETEQEISDSLKEFGLRPIERLDQLGIVSSKFLAAHMTQVSASDRELLAARGVSIAHCPESNLKLASGFCPVQDLTEAGVNVALGTDGAASNNDADMLGEMRIAALLAKGVTKNAAALPAKQALRMATLAGAKALGMEDVIGSIEVGKQADLAAVDLSAIASQPVYNPISQVVYTAASGQVSDVWVAGIQQLSDGGLTRCDSKELIATAAAWQAKISKQAR